MNKKLVLATVATIAAIATAQGVKADETNVQGTTTTGTETSGVTASNSGRSGEKENETASTVEQPTAKDSNAEAGSESNNPDKSGNATEFTKNGSDIQVTNPEVVVDQSNGTGKYQPFSVEYKNIEFPDDLTINEGDKVTFTLPEEVKFQTKTTKGEGRRMIISTEEWIKFREDGQKFSLEKLEEIFPNNDDEVENE